MSQPETIASSYLDNDLSALMRFAREHLVGGNRFLQGYDAPDRDREFALLAHLHQLRQIGRIDVDDQVIRSHAIFLCELPAWAHDRGDDNSSGLYDTEQLVLVFATDRVNDDVSAPSQLRNFSRLGVEHLVCPKRSHVVLIAAIDGSNYRELPRVRKLNRIGADAAGSTMNNDRLPGLRSGVVEQHLPRGHSDDRYCCPFKV